MTNLSIGKKLGVAFGASLLILLALSGLAFAKLSGLNANVAEFSENRMPKAVLAGLLDAATSDYRITIARHILSISPREIADAEEHVNSQVATVKQLTADLGARLNTPESHAKMAEFAIGWQALRKADEAVLVLSRVNDNDKARALFFADETQYQTTNKTINDLREIFKQQTEAAKTEADAAYETAKTTLLLGLLVALAATIGSLMLMVRQIATPIALMTGVMGEMTAGRLEAEIAIAPRTDEIGRLAGAIRAFRDQLLGAEAAKQAQVELITASVGTGLGALSAGDLTHRIDADLTGPFAKLKSDYNGAMESVGATLAAVNRSTAGIRTGATEISQASDDLSRRTEQQAASLEETAAAMDEITATVRETASGATRANQVVAATRSDAEDGGRIVAEAVQAMGGIERASSEISEIISVIDGIAFQTNLLALNAGVEAARAGDAGRGFAVVASEVRALAQRSAEAAKDVKTKIMASTGQVETGVTLVNETGRALERIVGRIAEISDLVSQIATSAEQQASGLQQVNTAVGEMDSVTQQNAAMVEESTAAARSLAAEAEDLARHVARFRIGSDMAPAHAHAHAQSRASAPVRKIAVARKPATGGAPATHGALALKIEPDADDWSRF